MSTSQFPMFSWTNLLLTHCLPLVAIPMPDPCMVRHAPVRDSSLRGVRVVFLIGADCPISRQYVPLIRSVGATGQTRGLREVSVVFCNGPRRVHGKVASAFMKEHDLDLPWRTDPKNRYARRMGATVVPEVLVFRSRHLLYSGAIDDMFAGLGLRRPVTSEHYLEDALEAIRNGRLPDPARRHAYGCLIE